jgi:hypothetical protein
MDKKITHGNNLNSIHIWELWCKHWQKWWDSVFGVNTCVPLLDSCMIFLNRSSSMKSKNLAFLSAIIRKCRHSGRVVPPFRAHLTQCMLNRRRTSICVQRQLPCQLVAVTLSSILMCDVWRGLLATVSKATKSTSQEIAHLSFVFQE